MQVKSEGFNAALLAKVAGHLLSFADFNVTYSPCKSAKAKIQLSADVWTGGETVVNTTCLVCFEKTYSVDPAGNCIQCPAGAVVLEVDNSTLMRAIGGLLSLIMAYLKVTIRPPVRLFRELVSNRNVCAVLYRQQGSKWYIGG